MRKITVIEAEIEGHGRFGTSGLGFDLMIERYLPNSVVGLVALIHEKNGHEVDYSDVESVSELLLILAQIDGYAVDNHMLSWNRAIDQGLPAQIPSPRS